MVRMRENLTSRQSFDGFSGFIHKYNSTLDNMTLEDGGSTWGETYPLATVLHIQPPVETD